MSAPVTANAIPSLSAVSAADWDACAGSDNPFVSHAFLSSLEDSGCVGPGTGWSPYYVTIERDGAQFAACGPGDYVGEMSFLTGNMASATARTAKPVRLLTFDQARLRQAARTDAGIRRVLEGSLNSNLVDKLVRSHGPVAEGSASGA